MKKKLALSLAFAFTMGLAGTAFADSNPFVDVPKGHWSYDAVTKLAKDKIVDGYSDKTFQGDKEMTRYEMAQVVAKAVSKADKASAEDKALIQKLYTEYKDELKGMNVRISALEGDVAELKAKDNISIFGFVRTKYDSDKVKVDGNDVNHNGGNKHTYMDFEGTMKVNDTWQGHFQLESNYRYTNSGWTKDKSYAAGVGGDNESNGVIQRAWVTGKIGSIGVTAGKKWWGYGNCFLYGHAASGVQLDLPLGGKTTLSVFDIRPSQGGLTTNSFYDYNNTSFYGGEINTQFSNKFSGSIAYGGNQKSVDDRKSIDGLKDVTSWGSIGLAYKFASDWKVTGTYVKTNADDYEGPRDVDNKNSSYQIRLDYKAADLNKAKSYGAYFRYFNCGLQGDVSHDDEWSSIPGDMKGWLLGVDYVLAKNIQWTTIYGDQKINVSGFDKYTPKETKRTLIRTQVDFHF